MRLYPVLRQIHLWFTLVFGLPLMILSLTGAILVFAPEITEALEAAERRVEVAGDRLPLDTLLARVRQQHPELRPWSLSIEEEPDRALRSWLVQGAGVLTIDPYSGRVLNHFRYHDTPIGMVTALHRWLLVEDPAARRWVRNLISITTLLMALEVLVGIWVWAALPHRLARLKVDFRSGARLVVLRLHTLAGLVTSVLLIAIALTGISLFWHEPARVVVEALTGSRIEQPRRPDGPGLKPIADLDRAVALGRTALPQAPLSAILVPQSPGDPVVLQLKTPGNFVQSRVWVGDDPPRVLAVADGTRASLATRVRAFLYPFHIGNFGGWPVKLIWVVLSLMPAAFTVSGVWLWLVRRRRGAARAAVLRQA
ncbi:MAG: PepSY domain-containing protein [Thalassobaculales bacterium]